MASSDYARRPQLGVALKDPCLPNGLPFSGLGSAKPAPRFYADAAAATRSVCNGMFGSARYPKS